MAVFICLSGCTPPAAEAGPSEEKVVASKTYVPAAPETELGVSDRGVFSDLDSQVRLKLPKRLGALTLVHNPRKKLAVLYADAHPVKAYPTGRGRNFQRGGQTLKLRPGDHAELSNFKAMTISALGSGDRVPGGDADDDGLPDALDLLIGAHKTSINGASYGAGYIRISYPGGDVPREVGVCTDVVIRALRNSGTDLQSELYRDIARAPRAYPMVKRRNKHIDHRRVKTILPYFKRHFKARTIDLKDPKDPLRPGDIVFMDTFPRRSGPDHIGILSDTVGPSGYPMVINNWTDGYKTQPMDLLATIPITHRFRVSR